MLEIGFRICNIRLDMAFLGPECQIDFTDRQKNLGRLAAKSQKCKPEIEIRHLPP